ncbi:prepilin peptidase [Sulfobacillus thermosulfidooxidans]|uniref:prepilin peptidase n=1 Tax=Sulfobacillus thermosulfidooxidans TaxID=28034 RepID=UPI0006B5E5A7|nr:prepilin peptidase [Sulfobacillus thermosulfidooxidans]
MWEWVATGLWGLFAITQAISDARYRLLPFHRTGAAMLIGILADFGLGGLGSWWGHGIAALAFGAAGVGLWALGGLGLGDAATFAAFGAVFGGGLTLLIIAASYGIMSVVAMGLWMTHRPTRNLPLGIPLWLLSLGAWAWIMTPH